MTTIFPPPLRPGDTIFVVAPSGPLPREAFFAGLAWLQGRYRVRVKPDVMAREGFLAGDNARRAGELEAALADPDVKAVVAGRGGYGAMRVLERMALGALAASPRWVVGFSDVTALHIEASNQGVASIHGPNVTGLHGASAQDRLAWLNALEQPSGPVVWNGLRAVHAAGAQARGRAFGGNLALVEAMAAAGRLRVPEGAVLVLEDVDERPYRVDRMLTSLRLGGHLARASAIVLGEFTRCGAGPDGVSVEAVLAERTESLGIPVLSGAPFGHGATNRAFVLGREVVVAGESLTFV